MGHWREVCVERGQKNPQPLKLMIFKPVCRGLRFRVSCCCRLVLVFMSWAVQVEDRRRAFMEEALGSLIEGSWGAVMAVSKHLNRVSLSLSLSFHNTYISQQTTSI